MPTCFPALTAGLQSLLAECPDVGIEITAGLAGTVRDLLDNGGLDVAIMRSARAQSTPDSICHSRLCWIAGPDFAMPEDGVLPLAHVNEPCCYFREAIGALNEADVRWKSALSCTSLLGVHAMVRSGHAVAAVLEDEHVERSLFDHALDLPALGGFELDVAYPTERPSLLTKRFVTTVWEALHRAPSRRASPRP